MNLTQQNSAPPLREDESGAIRVGPSRVLLEIVLHEYNNGATPEAIVKAYPTATLAEVYATIAYYLDHRAEVESYLAQRESIAVAIAERANANRPNLDRLREKIDRHRANSLWARPIFVSWPMKTSTRIRSHS